jgi:hypothetical protein
MLAHRVHLIIGSATDLLFLRLITVVSQPQEEVPPSSGPLEGCGAAFPPWEASQSVLLPARHAVDRSWRRGWLSVC